MASEVDGPASATSVSVTTSEVGSRSVGRKWSVARGIPSDCVTGSTIDPTSVADPVAGESASAPVIAAITTSCLFKTISLPADDLANAFHILHGRIYECQSVQYET